MKFATFILIAVLAFASVVTAGVDCWPWKCPQEREARAIIGRHAYEKRIAGYGDAKVDDVKVDGVKVRGVMVNNREVVYPQE